MIFGFLGESVKSCFGGLEFSALAVVLEDLEGLSFNSLEAGERRPGGVDGSDVAIGRKAAAHHYEELFLGRSDTQDSDGKKERFRGKSKREQAMSRSLGIAKELKLEKMSHSAVLSKTPPSSRLPS